MFFGASSAPVLNAFLSELSSRVGKPSFLLNLLIILLLVLTAFPFPLQWKKWQSQPELTFKVTQANSNNSTVCQALTSTSGRFRMSSTLARSPLAAAFTSSSVMSPDSCVSKSFFSNWDSRSNHAKGTNPSNCKVDDRKKKKRGGGVETVFMWPSLVQSYLQRRCWRQSQRGRFWWQRQDCRSKKSHKPRPSGHCLSRSVAHGPPFQGSVEKWWIRLWLLTSGGVSWPIADTETIESALAGTINDCVELWIKKRW